MPKHVLVVFPEALSSFSKKLLARWGYEVTTRPPDIWIGSVIPPLIGACNESLHLPNPSSCRSQTRGQGACVRRRLLDRTAPVLHDIVHHEDGPIHTGVLMSGARCGRLKRKRSTFSRASPAPTFARKRDPHHQFHDLDLRRLEPGLGQDVLPRDPHVHIPLPCCHAAEQQALRWYGGRERDLLVIKCKAFSWRYTHQRMRRCPKQARRRASLALPCIPPRRLFQAAREGGPDAEGTASGI